MSLRFFCALILISGSMSCGKQESENALIDSVKSGSIEVAAPVSPEAGIPDKGDESSSADTVKIAEAYGDLDGDTISEKIIVINTSKQSDFGTIRNIEVYKKENGDWKLWHKSTGAVLPSGHGGMMGEPFSGITIERKCIVINHEGGSRGRWAYTHRYRFQNNDWYLIGATITFGTNCEYWKTYDYNLITGRVEAQHIDESCEEDSEEADKDEKFSFVLKGALHKMDNFYPGDNEVKIPGKEHSFYY